jgi:hypothetical protein
LKKSFEDRMTAMEEKWSKELEKVLSDNKALEAKNKSLMEDNKTKESEIARLKAEIE